MPKKRKEPTLYAVKRPDGTLVFEAVYCKQSRALEMAIQLDRELAEMFADRGFYFRPTINILKKLGYRVVKVKIVEVE